MRASELEKLLNIDPVLLLILAAWVLYWKGRALWISAKRNELTWFVVLLIVNTLGLLEILYIYVISRSKK